MDGPDHNFPMNRWFVSRYLFSAKREDFAQAVQAVQQDLETITKRQYDLKLTFYRAADPAASRLADGSKPDIVVGTADTLAQLSARKWNEADYIEARLTLRPEPGKPFTFPAKFTYATLSARWPDHRRIDIEVQPKEYGREISRQFFDNNFRMWTRGYDFN
ncbi:MAG: hypothetical protein KJ667_07520 [Alphaproteobacteria bacterium]|nr:hypothetical protein [Alphaproteobacteria bacterium]